MARGDTCYTCGAELYLKNPMMDHWACPDCEARQQAQDAADEQRYLMEQQVELQREQLEIQREQLELRRAAASQASASGASQAPATASEWRTAITDYLREKDLGPEVDNDGDIRFKIGNFTFLLCLDEKDLSFTQLLFPAFWSFESDDDRARGAASAMMTMAKAKFVKLFIVRDSMWIAIEQIFDSPEQFTKAFSRLVSAIQTGVRIFATLMRENESR